MVWSKVKFFRSRAAAALSPRALLVALASTGLCSLLRAEPAQLSGRLHQHSKTEQSADALAVINVLTAFIAAGENNDASGRAAYLARNVFFYGHRRTRVQASREIARLYRLWPKRKLSSNQKIDVFAIPHYPGVYRATTVFEYEMVNRDQERISGKSRITCLIKHDRDGVRIIGVDEKLLPESTRVD